MDETKEKTKEFIKLCLPQCDLEEFLKKYKSLTKKWSTDASLVLGLKRYKALSNKTRIIIKQILEEQEMCTCALSAILELSESTISRHLNILRDAGFVENHTRSYFTIWKALKN